MIFLMSATFARTDVAKAESSSRARTSPVPVVTLEKAQAAGISVRELSEASKLYIGKCVRCHKSYEPAVYSQELWDSWMSKMSKKAHLSLEQENLLTRYLAAYRANASAAATNRHDITSDNQRR